MLYIVHVCAFKLWLHESFSLHNVACHSDSALLLTTVDAAICYAGEDLVTLVYFVLQYVMPLYPCHMGGKYDFKAGVSLPSTFVWYHQHTV